VTDYPEIHGWSQWPAPAKINLFLQITGRREDGYHFLQTVFQLLDWGDSLQVRLRDDGQIIRAGADSYGVDERRVVVRERALQISLPQGGCTLRAVLCGQGLWCGLAACGAGGSQERYSAAGGCLVLGLKGDCGGLCVLPTLCTAVPSGVKASWDGG